MCKAVHVPHAVPALLHRCVGLRALILTCASSLCRQVTVGIAALQHLKTEHLLGAVVQAHAPQPHGLGEQDCAFDLCAFIYGSKPART